MSERGYLVPIGGAEEKHGDSVVLQRFVELCGGKHALIAVIPTASQVEDAGRRYARLFEDLGAREAWELPFERREDCQRSESLEILGRVSGIFLTGGNQLRLSTVLGGSPVADLIRRRSSEEGLHVAGTSAGAAILSEHMIAYGKDGCSPRSGSVTLAPGLGLLPNLIVDQHFWERNRLGRLLTALAYNPRLVGLGVDEDTGAFISPDNTIEVVGSSVVTVVDGARVDNSALAEAKPDQPISLFDLRLHVLAPGTIYQLSTV